MTLISNNLATSQQETGEWEPISGTRLMILVGVTGVGKTTTVNALRDTAVNHTFALLPNRRTLTDQLIIGELQQMDGEEVAPVADRAKRFEYTRRYRELNPGGMAHALSQLWVKKERSTAENHWLIFAGLRGENEVHHAAVLLPNAKFLVLDAPHFVRVQRLLGRGDAFDTISTTGQSSDQDDLLANTGDLFSAEQKSQLISLVTAGQLTADELKSKVEIVWKERQNDDPAAAIQTLRAEAASRTFVADTVTYQPEAIALQTIETLLT